MQQSGLICLKMEAFSMEPKHQRQNKNTWWCLKIFIATLNEKARKRIKTTILNNGTPAMIIATRVTTSPQAMIM